MRCLLLNLEKELNTIEDISNKKLKKRDKIISLEKTKPMMNLKMLQQKLWKQEKKGSRKMRLKEKLSKKLLKLWKINVKLSVSKDLWKLMIRLKRRSKIRRMKMIDLLRS